jgi:hypothetical protein
MRWIIVLFCLLASCSHRAYTLKIDGRAQILTPPPSKPEIKNARKHPARETGCDIESGAFTVAWHGNTANVRMKQETYFAPPPQQQVTQAPQAISITESGERVFVDSLARLEDFRQALAAKENAGCLRDTEAVHLRQAITEAFPFPPQIAAYLRFGTYGRTGFIDLIPGFNLRLVSPSGKDFEVSFYAATRVPGDERVRLALISGPGKPLTVPETPAFFRYLFWTGASAHNFRSTILGAPDRPAMDDATTRFLSDPEGFCPTPPSGIFCQSIATTIGTNVGFNILINGHEVFVRMGGSLGEAIGEDRNGLRLSGRSQPLPQNVTVRRLFHGKLIPVKPDSAKNSILALIAMPGDQIKFRH